MGCYDEFFVLYSFGVLFDGMGRRDEFFVMFFSIYFLMVWDLMVSLVFYTSMMFIC